MIYRGAVYDRYIERGGRRFKFISHLVFETSLEVVQDEEREKEPVRSLFGNRFMSIFDPNFVRMSRDTLKTLCKDSRLA